MATDASYGTFKFSMLAFSLGSSALLIIEKPKTQRALKFFITVLVFLVAVTLSVLMPTPFGAAILSNNLVVISQIIIKLWISFNFLWYFPWDRLIVLNTTKNNLNDTGLENPVAVTDDN